jgi:NADPH:quinone reductase-like Zn-dependent oxidoreductase
MIAVVHDRYGSPECLDLREIARPSPAPGEVLVRVRAASVNPADWVMLTGRPLAIRALAGIVRPRHGILGRDAAGVVEAVGAGVVHLHPGDAVFGQPLAIRGGAFAEYVCVPADRLAIKPARLSFEEAAACSLAGITALQCLRDHGRVGSGDEVLINGASGGVGTFAVQIAKALGARVTGVCSARNVDLVRGVGADAVVDYESEDFTRSEHRYDVILDLAGSRPLSACRRALKPSGRYVSSVGRAGWSLKALLASFFVRRPRVVVAHASQTPADLATLAALLASGAVTPVLERRYTLREAREALRHQGEGHARGKSVVIVTEASRAEEVPS